MRPAASKAANNVLDMNPPLLFCQFAGPAVRPACNLPADSNHPGLCSSSIVLPADEETPVCAAFMAVADYRHGS
jgi:hypothetical protein